MSTPPLFSLQHVADKIREAARVENWVVVLSFQGRMEELLEGQPDKTCEYFLHAFVNANIMHQGNLLRGSPDERAVCEHIVGLQERRVELLGRMGCVEEQGKVMHMIGTICLPFPDKRNEAERYLLQTPTLNLYPQHSTLTPHPSILNPTLNPQPATLNPQPSTLNSQSSPLSPPQPSTINPQPSHLNPQPYPQPSTINPQTSALYPQPSTINPHPSTLNHQPSTLNPQFQTWSLCPES